MSIITGVTQLSPKMTVLQLAAWIVYLIAVIPAFLAAGRAAPSAHPPASASAASDGPGRWERMLAGRTWLAAGVLVVVPVLVAGFVIVVLPTPDGAATTSVSVTRAGCGLGWTAGRTGLQSFAVTNKSSQAGEITLVNSSGAIVAEIETLGPSTTAAMTAALGPGAVQLRLPAGRGERAWQAGAGDRDRAARHGGGEAGDARRPERP
jgi:high-affinity iron transporter